jgi:hypothetical protein
MIFPSKSTLANPTDISMNANIEQWLSFLHDLRHSRVQPSVVHGTRCLTRCGRGQGAWQTSLQVADWMRLEGIQLDDICCNALVSCCGNGNQWQVGLVWLETKGKTPLITLNDLKIS